MQRYRNTLDQEYGCPYGDATRFLSPCSCKAEKRLQGQVKEVALPPHCDVTGMMVGIAESPSNFRIFQVGCSHDQLDVHWQTPGYFRYALVASSVQAREEVNDLG